MSKNLVLSRRFAVVLGIFLVWTVFVGFKTLWIAVIDRDFFIEKGEAAARYQGTLPALRGRIIDRNGVVLAWSERYFDLCISSDSVELMPEPEEIEPLKLILPRLKYSPPERELCRNLTPAEIMTLEGVIRDGKFPLYIRLREERIVVNTPELRRRVGTVRPENGILTGESGWEKEFDHILSAVSGRFSVLRDRWMNWIPASWQLVVPPEDGRDAVVPFSVSGEADVADMVKER